MAIQLNPSSRRLDITIESPVFEASSAHHLSEQWQGHRQSDIQTVCVNLAHVESIDSIAISALLHLKQELSSGVAFSLENACPDVRRVFRLLGIDRELHSAPASN